MFPIWLAAALFFISYSTFFIRKMKKDGERDRNLRVAQLTLRYTFSVPSKVKAMRFGINEIS